MGSSRGRPPDRDPATGVVLLTTCLVDQLRPDIGEAVVRVLERRGVTAAPARGATCCGQPAWNTGLIPAARRVARRTLRALRRTHGPVVVPSGSCATMIREFWPRLFAGTADEAAAIGVARRVRELSDFLDGGLAAGSPAVGPSQPAERAAPSPDARPAPEGRDGSPTPRVAYHDSCHMLRELGIQAAPRRLLAAVGVDVAELDEPHWCCGFGGTFAVKLPEVSTAMADAKLDAVVAAGADRIVGCDLSCLIHLQGRADRRGLGVRALHLAEVLDGAGGSPPGRGGAAPVGPHADASSHGG